MDKNNLSKIDSLVAKNGYSCRLIIEELGVDIEKLSILFFWDIYFEKNEPKLRKPSLGDISLFPIGKGFDIENLYEITISKIDEEKAIIYANVLEEYEGIEDYNQRKNKNLQNLINKTT